MQGTVELHALVRMNFEVEVERGGEDAMIIAAILKAQELNFDLAEFPTFLRYLVTVRRPGEPPNVTLYHDRDELDLLHEERLNDAAIFDLDTLFLLDAPEDTEIARSVPEYNAAN